MIFHLGVSEYEEEDDDDDEDENEEEEHHKMDGYGLLAVFILLFFKIRTNGNIFIISHCI